MYHLSYSNYFKIQLSNNISEKTNKIQYPFPVITNFTV